MVIQNPVMDVVMFWLYEYPHIVLRRMWSILRYVWQFLSLDLVFSQFFTPYKKANNIAGWTVGILFKLGYLLVALPLFVVLMIVITILFLVVPIAIPLFIFITVVSFVAGLIK